MLALRTCRRIALTELGTAAAFLLIGGCRDVTSHLAPTPGADTTGLQLVALYGDQVNGEPGSADDAEPLVVALRNGLGRPLPNAHITWSAAGDGSIVEAEDVTDGAGLASASWMLGDNSTSQVAVASTFGHEVRFRGWVRRSPSIAADTLFPLHLTTYEGSGQVVHPDVVFLPHSWDGGTARLAMAITPYPYGDAHRENPSIFVSESGIDWTLPAEAANPIVLPTTTDAYLSDPALVFDPSAHQLRMYYREVVDSENVLHLLTSADGVYWSPPREIVRVPSHGLVSPSVVRRSATNWLMWSVDGGPDGCSNKDASVDLRGSADGIQWGAPLRVFLNQPGGYPWHIDVKWIGALQQYWALYNLKAPGSCATPAVYLATSPDGVQWTTYRNPVLQRGAIAELGDIVYRSSFVYTKSDDMVTFYFSGARWDSAHYVWTGAVQRRSRQALFSSLQQIDAPALLRARWELPAPEPFVERVRRPINGTARPLR
jgi:hypothetical protein